MIVCPVQITHTEAGEFLIGNKMIIYLYPHGSGGGGGDSELTDESIIASLLRICMYTTGTLHRRRGSRRFPPLSAAT